MEDFYGKSSHYNRVIEIAKEEWLLSTDGVVKALQYDNKRKRMCGKD
jgi:prophage antirepressor-like protein